MSGRLIYRHNAVSEYSELLSTKVSPNRELRRTRRRLRQDIHPMDIAMSSMSSPEDRYRTILPPLEDVKTLIRRVQSYGSVSQATVFNALAPLLAFSAFLTLGVIALQPHSFAHHVLSAPREHTSELLWGTLFAFGDLSIALIVLRALVWLTAFGLKVILDVEDRQATFQDKPRYGEDGTQIPDSAGALVLGVLQ